MMDALTVRPLLLRKLFTREDRAYFHLHKTLGLLSLCNYMYRFWEWYIYGHMQFDGSLFTLQCICVHIALSCSSMIFHLPTQRNRSAPMIWPEFRLHSIIFAMRSLVVMLHFWMQYYPIYNQLNIDVKPFVIIITMLSADYITASHRIQGSTMRAMPYPDYIPLWFIGCHNIFYSICQIYATLEILVRPNMSFSYMILFPIQLAAFLMTCVRKSIITAAGWHLWYTVALLSTIVYANTINEMNIFQLYVYHSFVICYVVGRFVFNIDKYTIWLTYIFANSYLKLF